MDDCRAYVDDLLARAVPQLGNLEPFATGPCGDRVWHECTNDAANGEPCAEVLLDQLGRDGAQRFLKREKERLARGVLIVRHADGMQERRPNQGFRGLAKQKKDGTREVQQGLWWDFSYAEIVALVKGIDRAFLGAAEKRATFHRVLSAYEAHRDAPTAAEACRRAGFDPQEIEISDADIRRARAA